MIISHRYKHIQKGDKQSAVYHKNTNTKNAKRRISLCRFAVYPPCACGKPWLWRVGAWRGRMDGRACQVLTSIKSDKM